MNPVPPKTAVRNILLLAAACLIATGCAGHKPVAWNVNVKKVTNASIEVDLVGISPSEDSYWRNVKPDDYWNPGKSIRQGILSRAVTTRFDKDSTLVVKVDDRIWKQWLGYGANELLVMANLPGRFDNSIADPRRLILPLRNGAFDGKVIQIEILDGQIRVLTPQNM